MINRAFFKKFMISELLAVLKQVFQALNYYMAEETVNLLIYLLILKEKNKVKLKRNTSYVSLLNIKNGLKKLFLILKMQTSYGKTEENK